jgi:hypothetical protein
MHNGEVAAYIGRWRPSTVSAPAAAFARDVITAVGPEGKERAKNLLWAAGKLADYAIGLGLDPAPEVVLHPSTAERFTRCAPGLSGVARRTLRTNLRFIGRRVVPHLYPADLPLPRERAKKPYSPAQIDGFLALAGAQPTAGRRMRAAGLVCPGLLPRLPLLLSPLRGTPLLPGRRPAPRQVIGARRHRGIPGIPGRGPQGRVQLPLQLRDQRGQRLDLPRLLADQRITRILRRQRLGHATRSSPKPAQPAAAIHSSPRNRDPGIPNPASPKTQANKGT